MRPRASVLILAALIVPLFSHCSDKSPTGVDDGSLESQVRALFPAGSSLRDDALLKLIAIREQLAASAPANARSQTLGLVDLTLTAFHGGQLTGGTSVTTGNAVAKLVNGLYQLAGMDPPQIPDGSLGGDGTAQVVGPAGGTVVTPTGAAGVVIPPGALPEQVVVTINRLATTPTPGSGPLPTSLKQYPPYYDYATFPAVAQFGDSMRVGVCQVTDPSSPLYPPEPHDRLRLAHGVGSTIQILDRVDVNDFLKCTGVSANRSVTQSGWRGMLASVADRVAGMVRPAELYAAHGGLGGKVKSFSPFGAVDPGAPTFTKRLAANVDAVCALDPAGAAYCWGDMFSTGTGEPGGTGIVPSPQRVLTTMSFTALTGGSFEECGLTSAGALHCWGDNQNGQYGYGQGDTLSSFTPRPSAPGLGLTWVSAGGFQVCGIVFSGVTYCWGQNRSGSLGNGNLATFISGPVRVATAVPFVSVSSGLTHTCGLAADGVAYCWGNGTSGALGNGSASNAAVPVAVVGGLKFTKIGTGANTTCGIATDGTYCWGVNKVGQLGADTGSCPLDHFPNALCPSTVPVKVSGGLSFVDVMVAEQFACGLTSSGAAYCWGDNFSGELGNGTMGVVTATTGVDPVASPVPVSGGLRFTTLTGGRSYACGAITDGTIYCWGANSVGQIGQGSTATPFYTTPQQVNGISLK